MHKFFFEELDSTSNKASQLISEGQHAPFVVVAKNQTAGRGRRGRSWNSVDGNIFLTFVMPPPTDAIKQMGLIPIKASVVLADWMYQRFGVRVTIKWPNDILFAGQKIAGILCESSTVGKSWGKLSIGIGINLKAVPEGELEYPVISLQDILNTNFDYDEVLQSLILYFDEHWHKFEEQDILDRFTFFAIDQGQPWWDKKLRNLIYKNENLDIDGSLILKPSHCEKSTLSLASVSHEFGWVYQNHDTKNTPLLIADVGNTATKIIGYSVLHENSVVRFILNDDSEQSLNDFKNELQKLHLPMQLEGGKWPIHIFSVNKEKEELLERVCSKLSLYTQKVSKRPVLYRLGNYDFHQMGIDRLALMEGWLQNIKKYCLSYKIGVLVSCGTATTIDVIDSEGWHKGGYILSGMQTSLEALSEKTSLLPKIDLMDSKICSTDFGKNTQEAMIHGSIRVVIAMINDICNELQLKGVSKDQIEVVVVGGNAYILEYFGYQKNPNLYFEGLKSMVLGGFYYNSNMEVK